MDLLTYLWCFSFLAPIVIYIILNKLYRKRLMIYFKKNNKQVIATVIEGIILIIIIPITILGVALSGFAILDMLSNLYR